jgi:hypothetical protein
LEEDSNKDILVSVNKTHDQSGFDYNPSERLLRSAIEKGYSFDGEMFSIHNLLQLCCDYCHTDEDYLNRFELDSFRFTVEETSIVLTSEYLRSCFPPLNTEPSRAISEEKKYKFVLLPYDRDSQGSNRPVFAQGLNAHYAAVIGVMRCYLHDAQEFPCEVSFHQSKQSERVNPSMLQMATEVDEKLDECNISNFDDFVHREHEIFNAKVIEDMEDARMMEFVICAQSMSPRPVISPIQDWIQSNSQLRLAKTKGTAQSWKVDEVEGPSLCGKSLVIEFSP